jgi:hypothetical protein
VIRHRAEGAGRFARLKTKPFGEFGVRWRNDTTLTSISKRTPSIASSGVLQPIKRRQ